MDANSTIKNCTFKNNDGRYFGGGIFFGQENVNNITKPTVDSCVIVGNMVDQGGAGIYAVHALPKITNTIIANNTGDYANAVFGSHAEITLQGCVIYGNKSTKSTVALGCVEGGADGRGKLLINHCTVADNVTSADTSLGVYAVFLEKESKNNIITNSIFWNNTGRFISDSVNATVSYCAIQNGYPGDTILTADPLLDSAYALKTGSPCIDKASDDTDIGAYQTAGRNPLLLRAQRMAVKNRRFVPGQRPQSFCPGQHLYPPMCR